MLGKAVCLYVLKQSSLVVIQSSENECVGCISMHMERIAGNTTLPSGSAGKLVCMTHCHSACTSEGVTTCLAM